MDTSVQKLSKLVQQHSWQLTNKRLILPVIILALLISTSPLRELTIQVLADGFGKSPPMLQQPLLSMSLFQQN